MEENNYIGAKFLIIRFSSIGDIVLTTPVIRNLKKQSEASEVHFLTKEAHAGIVESNPYVDKVYSLSDNFSQIMRQLKKERYHYIIDLHNNLRTFRVKRYLKTMHFTFDKVNAAKWILVNLKVNRMPELHIVNRYMKTIELFIDANDNKGLDYFIDPEEEQQAMNHAPKGDYCCIVVGAKHATKQIPKDKIVQIIAGIKSTVVLLGGKEDEENAKAIESTTTKAIINLAGKLSLNDSAAILKNCQIVITPDTGLMHIAAAFNKPIISVWGNTVPEFGMSPYLPHSNSKIFEVKNIKCRPCSKIGYDKCPKGHFRCMEEQDYKEVVRLANDSVLIEE